MKHYTFRVVLYIDRVAESEEEALELVETELYNDDLEAESIDLYEVEGFDLDEYIADDINDRRKG